MEGKTVLITGGMGGVGTAIAQHMVTRGAKVAVSYNKGGNHLAAKTWQQTQAAQGYQFTIAYGDITDFNSVSQMVDDLIKTYGKIDILVNNAGITEDVTLMKMSFTQWHKVINTNFNGIFNITRHILNHMVENQYGRIINISSINGQKGQYGQTNYCAAKAGIHGFTKALAYEVAKKGVTVNTVSPGHVKTPMLDGISTTILDKIIQQIPIGRLAEPIEIARMVGFLAEKDSGYITGSNFSINGGQHMF